MHHARRSVHRTRCNGCTYVGTVDSVQSTHRRQERHNLLRFAFGEMFSDEVVDGVDVGPVEEGRTGSSVLILFAMFVLRRALITAAGGMRTPHTTT